LRRAGAQVSEHFHNYGRALDRLAAQPAGQRDVKRKSLLWDIPYCLRPVQAWKEFLLGVEERTNTGGAVMDEGREEKSSRTRLGGEDRPADSASQQLSDLAVPQVQSGALVAPSIQEPPSGPRFRIFIVDAGWNSPARRVLQENFALIRDLQRDDPIYVLSREKSIEFMRHHGSRIGRDPIIAVHDMRALGESGADGFHGFRLSLGLLRTPERALLGLQSFARFLATHRDATDLEADIRADLRREGIAGAIEIMIHHEARDLLSD
jgi:hypothetical protein